MNLEAMFFPNVNINHQFDEIVMGCAELINTYTVESNFDEIRVKKSLVKHKGQVRSDMHSGGNIFQFEFYGTTFPQEFKIEFSGENKMFKVVYEIDSSNPQGFLTLFAADSTSVLTKEVKEMLKRISDNATEFVQNEIDNNKESEAVETLQESHVEEIVEQEDPVQQERDRILQDPAVKDEDRVHCKCPNNQEDLKEDQVLIEHFSDKVTRHFHVNGAEQLTIYQCKYCKTFLMIENRPERSGKSNTKVLYLDSKTANYLLSIGDQLQGLIHEKGIDVVHQIISGTTS